MADPATPAAPAAEPAVPTNAPEPKQDKTPEPAPSGDTPKPEERTVPYDRFKEVNEKLKAIEAKEAEAEQKRLEEQGKWQELAEKQKVEADTAKKQVLEARIENRVISEANKLGIVDPEAALALVNRKVIDVADDGTVTGVEEALKQLTVDKPYLVSKETPSRIGSGSNPSSDGDTSPDATKIKLSQIRDPQFYKENRDKIMDAMKKGTIIDDTV